MMNEIVRFRTTKEEKMLIKAAAKKEALSISDYIRIKTILEKE